MSDEEVDGASWATEDSLESQLWIQEDSSYFQTSSEETLQALAEAEAVAPAGAGDAATLPPPPPQPPPPSSEGTRKAQDPTCCSLHQTDDSRPAQGTTPAEAAERSCPTKRSNETPESFTCDPPCRSPHQTDDSRPAQVTAPPQTTESRCTSRRPNESPESFTRMARPEVSWRPPPTAWPPTAPRCVPWMQPYCYPLHWAPTPVAAAPFPHYPAHVAAPAACGAPGDVCLEQLRALALQNQATLSTLTSMYQALLSETMRLCGLHLAAASSMSHAPFAAPHPLALGAGAGSYSSLASWPHAYGPCQAVPAQPADSGRSPGPGPGPTPGPSPGQQALWGARAHGGGSGGVEEKGGQPPPCETSGSAAASDSRQLSRAEGAAPAPPSQDGRDPSSGVEWERARPPTRGLAPEVEKIPSATKASRPVPSPSFHRTRDPLEQPLRQSVALSGGDQRRALKPQPPRATSLDRRFQSASRAHSLFRCDSLHGRCQHSGPGDPPRWPQPPGATAAALRACYLVQQFPPAEEQRSRGCPAPVAPPTPPPPPAPAPAPPKCPPLGASQSATQRDARPKPPPRVSVGVGSSPPRSAVAAAHPRRPPAPAPAPLPLPLPPSSLSQPCEARSVAGARGRALASLQRAFRENMAPLGARPTGGAARARANAEAPPQRSAPMADAAQQQMWAEASELGLIMPLSRFFATNAFNIVLGDLVNVHESKVCRLIKSVSEAICLVLKTRYVYFPPRREHVRIKAGFAQLSRAAAQGAEEQAAQAAFLLEVLARHPDLVPATDTPGACAQRPPGGARAN